MRDLVVVIVRNSQIQSQPALYGNFIIRWLEQNLSQAPSNAANN